MLGISANSTFDIPPWSCMFDCIVTVNFEWLSTFYNFEQVVVDLEWIIIDCDMVFDDCVDLLQMLGDFK